MLSDHKTLFFTSPVPFMSDSRIISLLDMPERTASYGSFALRKGSESRQLFDFHLIKAKQSGLLDFTIEHWLRDGKPKAFSSTAELDVQALGFDHLLFIVLVMAAGAAGALIFAIVEHFHNKLIMTSNVRNQSRIF